MGRIFRLVALAIIAPAVFIVVAPHTLSAQAQQTLKGRVTEPPSTTGAQASGIPEVRVIVEGTSLFAVTNQDGYYSILNVPAGTYQVRSLRIGYHEQKKQVTVGTETATLDFALVPSPLALSEIVTTATGERRRATIGNNIAQIDAANITENEVIENTAWLMASRAPGVTVHTNNVVGGASRIRIRGSSSLSLTNDPIVIMDGMRITSSSGSNALTQGGTRASRLDDINPDEIESIEIVKGPSASTLYGTDAANGVVVITTKRGKPGKTQFRVYGENGVVKDRNTYPSNYSLAGRVAGGAQLGLFTNNCNLQNIVPIVPASSASCNADSLRIFNPWADKQATPLDAGQRYQYGLQITGGSEVLRYFSAFEREENDGVFRIPAFDFARVDSQKSLSAENIRPNGMKRTSGRLNLNANLSDELDMGFSIAYIDKEHRMIPNDNNTVGLASQIFGGRGFRNDTLASGFRLNGYRSVRAGDIFQEEFRQDINRFIGGMNANWRPSSWLAARANAGVDFTHRLETNLCRFNECVEFATFRAGFKEDYRANIFTYTVDLNASASFQPRPWLGTRTTIGTQYFYDVNDRVGTNGQNLPGGASTITPGVITNADESTTLGKTFGVFLEEVVSIRDLLYVTAGIRGDNNSAFGQDFKAVYYPKLSVSYIVSEESIFPQIKLLNQLRLRGAVGSSGTRPGTTDAQQFFLGAAVNERGVDLAGITFANLGNPNLKPERSSEREIGFDAKLWDDRISTELTVYNKKTHDALIARTLPPSTGGGFSNQSGSVTINSRFENIGSVSNKGTELSVTAQLVDTRKLGADITFARATHRNKLLSLGGAPSVVFGEGRHVVGYPLSGYWAKPITFAADTNGNGIIETHEVKVGDTEVFLGSSQPTSETLIFGGIDLLGKKLRISTLVDRKAGHKLYNNTERIRCVTRGNCRGLVDATAPLWEQARSVAARVNSPTSTTIAGYIEDASFWRWRELSATYELPSNLTRWNSLGARTSITLAARNIAKSTKYTGVDPESNYDTVNDLPSDFQTSPAPTYYTFRVNVRF